MIQRPYLAIFCLCLGLCIFSVQDLIIKLMAGRYPITEAMTLRSVVAMPILAVMVAASGGIGQLRSAHGWLLALRSLCSFCSYMFYYLALAALPLADAVALFFVTPLVLSGLAAVVLKEPLRWHTLLALCLGFVGVTVTLRPGDAVFEWAGLLVISAAFFYSTAQVIARSLRNSTQAPTLTFYQNLGFLIGAPIIAGAAHFMDTSQLAHPSVQFLLRPWVWPTTIDFGLMAACGVIAAVSMTLLSQAYRLAPAAKVSIFEYTSIIWGPLWGLTFLGEIPRWTTWVGAAIICGAGILALTLDRRPAPAPAAA